MATTIQTHSPPTGSQSQQPNPQLKRLVYSKYRELLGSYNDKANTIIQSLPSYMVSEDKGFHFDGIDDIKSEYGAPQAPPLPGSIPAPRLQTQLPASAPACVQNAMMTKDKKPFTYTPGGIDLSEIKSPRMAKRIARNAQYEGVGNTPARPSPLAQPNSPQSPSLGAAAMGMPFQVLPSGPPPPPPPPSAGMQGGGVPPPPPPPQQQIKNHLSPQTNGVEAARKSPTPQNFEPPPFGNRPEIKIPENPISTLKKVPRPREKNDFWIEEYRKERSTSPMPQNAAPAVPSTYQAPQPPIVSAVNQAPYLQQAQSHPQAVRSPSPIKPSQQEQQNTHAQFERNTQGPLSPQRVNQQQPIYTRSVAATQQENTPSPTPQQQQQKAAQVGSIYIPPVAPENLATSKQPQQPPWQSPPLNTSTTPRWLAQKPVQKEVPEWVRDENAPPSPNSSPQRLIHQTSPPQSSPVNTNSGGIPGTTQLKFNLNQPTALNAKERIIPIQLEQSPTPTRTPSTPGFGPQPFYNTNQQFSSVSSPVSSTSNPGYGSPVYITPGRNPNQFVDQGYNNYATAPPQWPSQQRVTSPQRQVIMQASYPQPQSPSGSTTRIIPIAIEGQDMSTQGPFNPNAVRGPVSNAPLVINNDPRTLQHQNSWSNGGPPNQSKSFKILQKLTDTEINNEDGTNRPQYGRPLSTVGSSDQCSSPTSPPVDQMRRMQLNDEDKAFMNRVKNQVDQEIFLHKEEDPRYRGSSIPSKSFKYLQNMIDKKDNKNSSTTSSDSCNSNISKGQGKLKKQQTKQQVTEQQEKGGQQQGPGNQRPMQQNPKFIQQKPMYSQEGVPQPYIHPSEQQVPEPKKYTGSAIPSRSFKILQAMTTPENAAEMEGSDVEHEQIPPYPNYYPPHPAHPAHPPPYPHYPPPYNLYHPYPPPPPPLYYHHPPPPHTAHGHQQNQHHPPEPHLANWHYPYPPHLYYQYYPPYEYDSQQVYGDYNNNNNNNGNSCKSDGNGYYPLYYPSYPPYFDQSFNGKIQQNNEMFQDSVDVGIHGGDPNLLMHPSPIPEEKEDVSCSQNDELFSSELNEQTEIEDEDEEEMEMDEESSLSAEESILDKLTKKLNEIVDKPPDVETNIDGANEKEYVGETSKNLKMSPSASDSLDHSEKLKIENTNYKEETDQDDDQDNSSSSCDSEPEEGELQIPKMNSRDGLQAIKSVTDITVYDTDEEDEHFEYSSYKSPENGSLNEKNNIKAKTLNENQKDDDDVEMEYQSKPIVTYDEGENEDNVYEDDDEIIMQDALSVIYEESEETDVVLSEPRADSRASMGSTLSDCSTTIANDDDDVDNFEHGSANTEEHKRKMSEQIELDDEQLVTTVRLPLKLSFSRSSNDESVTTVTVGDSQIEDKRASPIKSPTISENKVASKQNNKNNENNEKSDDNDDDDDDESDEDVNVSVTFSVPPRGGSYERNNFKKSSSTCNEYTSAKEEENSDSDSDTDSVSISISLPMKRDKFVKDTLSGDLTNDISSLTSEYDTCDEVDKNNNEIQSDEEGIENTSDDETIDGGDNNERDKKEASKATNKVVEWIEKNSPLGKDCDPEQVQSQETDYESFDEMSTLSPVKYLKDNKDETDEDECDKQEKEEEQNKKETNDSKATIAIEEESEDESCTEKEMSGESDEECNFNSSSDEEEIKGNTKETVKGNDKSSENMEPNAEIYSEDKISYDSDVEDTEDISRKRERLSEETLVASSDESTERKSSIASTVKEVDVESANIKWNSDPKENDGWDWDSISSAPNETVEENVENSKENNDSTELPSIEQLDDKDGNPKNEDIKNIKEELEASIAENEKKYTEEDEEEESEYEEIEEEVSEEIDLEVEVEENDDEDEREEVDENKIPIAHKDQSKDSSTKSLDSNNVDNESNNNEKEKELEAIDESESHDTESEGSDSTTSDSDDDEVEDEIVLDPTIQKKHEKMKKLLASSFDLGESPLPSSIDNEVKVSVKDHISKFESGAASPTATSSSAKNNLKVPPTKINSKQSKTLSRGSSQSELEEDDSGVTDMSKPISETDTESEEFSELRKMTRYQRAATHSRLFKLLQDETSTEENTEEIVTTEQSVTATTASTESNELKDENQSTKSSVTSQKKKIVHNVSITRKRNPEIVKDAETMSQRRERLSLPLQKTDSIDADNPSSSDSPSSPHGERYVITDKLVNELVQSLLLKKKSRYLRSLPMEKLQAAAKRVLEEDLDSLENTSIDSTPALTPQEFKSEYSNSYADYYESWNSNGYPYNQDLASTSSSSSVGNSAQLDYDILPSKAFKTLQEQSISGKRKPWAARCPRVLSSKTINRDLSRVNESPEMYRSASVAPTSGTRQSVSPEKSQSDFKRGGSLSRFGKV